MQPLLILVRVFSIVLIASAEDSDGNNASCLKSWSYGAAVENSSCSGAQISALERARALTTPQMTMTKGGEFEGGDFWEEHDLLLKQAWMEVPRLHKGLYSFNKAFEQRYLQPRFIDAVAAARQGRGEADIRGLFEPVATGSPGIWASTHIFTDAFRDDMLDELVHVGQLGIPMRRPNGMNRYGAILDEVGFERMFNDLVAKYIRPLAEMFFPETVSRGDTEEHYAFTVRYTEGEDVELAKHRDASVATLNICLGRDFSGGDLRFFGNGKLLGRHLAQWASLEEKEQSVKSETTMTDDLVFTPGMVVLHRGQHQHQALRLLGGERTNLIVWLFAKYGVVRVAPYKPQDQLTLEERWRPVESESRVLPDIIQ